MTARIGLVIHNIEHRRLVDALGMVGALERNNIALLVPGQGYTAQPFDAIVVVDAPEYVERSSAAFMAGYRQWLDDLRLSMRVGAKITYLHPAGEPM